MSVSYTPSGMRAAVAEAVRIELARRRMSASDLARRIGKAQQYLSRRMTGDAPFDTDDLALIATELEVSVAALLPAEPAEVAR